MGSSGSRESPKEDNPYDYYRFDYSSEGIEIYASSWCEVEKNMDWRDLLDPEVAQNIPEHWLDYPPASHCISYFLAVVYSILVVFGIVGNLMVLFLYFKFKSLRTPSNMLLANLSASDMVMNCTGIGFIYNTFHCGPALTRWGCKLYGFLGGVTGTVSICTIAAMAVDRHAVISNPLGGRRLTMWTALMSNVLIWAYALLFTLPPLLEVYNGFVPEGYLTSCSFDYLTDNLSSRIYIFVYFLASYCFALIIIMFSYYGIFKAVGKSEKTFGKSSTSISTVGSMKEKGKTDTKEKKKQSQEIHVAKMAFGLISLWFVAWTPYAVVALIGVFGDRSLLTPTLSELPAIFAKFSAVINPFVYSLSHPGFKKALKATLKPSQKKAKKGKDCDDSDTIHSQLS